MRGARAATRAARRASRPLHEERYGYRDPDGDGRARHGARHRAACPAPRLDLGAAGGAASRVTGPDRASRLPEATLVVPEGWARRGRRHRHARAGARGMSARPDHAAGRQPARCARRARRWAPCSSARPTRRTSRSAATARPRSSTPTGEMVMQAEHIPVHLGAMPAAVAAVLDARPRARASRGSSTTRTRAAPTCPTSRSSRPPSHDGELLGFAAEPRPPRRRRRPRRRARCRPTRRRSTRRASSSRRACSTTRRSTSWPRRCASPRSAAPTCAPSSPPTAPARGGWRARRARSGPDGLRAATDEVLDYAERRTRACLAALPRRRRATRATCSRRREGDLELRAAPRPSPATS